MPSTLFIQTLNNLERFLAHELSAHELESWLLGASWNVLKWGDPETIAAVGDVGLLLAEFDQGDLTEADLRRWVREFIDSTIGHRGMIGERAATVE